MQPAKKYTPNWIVIFLMTIVVFFLFVLSFYRLEIDGDIIGSLPENDPVISDARHVMMYHPMQDQVVIDICLDRTEPDLLVDISDAFDTRMDAIKAYSTQFHTDASGGQGPQTYISTPDFLDSVIARARMLGKRIGVKYAEGFITEKKIGIRNLDALVLIET